MLDHTGHTGRGLDRPARLRRLRFRAWHRGMRETDLVLGCFADAELDGMNDTEIREFEALLDVPDQVFMAWMTGAEPVPAADRSAVLQRILARHAGRSGPAR